MKSSITDQINEAQLADKIRESEDHLRRDANYLFLFCLYRPDRGKNLALTALTRSINNITIKKIPLFYWQYSIEGKKLAEKLATHLGVDLFARKE